uniref:UBC core domain-containing protein n=1 Tax=Percolomonas cosmopolitus TaxID=63605 RepID=A0A7S1PFT5_9EUKA|mmetsp:Transcript_1832/g.6504  ORF Transcript_1832/g.6504 Transcript_1832/m.6504 type:complete len:319 (+) Transcript_1832:228-1184(+)
MNTSHSAIKRLLNEYKDFTKNPSSVIHAAPLTQSNLFEWHFTIKGPIESPFQGGVYHGRVLLPTDYPYKPPDVVLLTPNGRFECHKKICLNLTSFHQESWHPGCSIRTLLLSLRMFFLEEESGVGSIQYNDKDRATLALESQSWHCEKCDCKMLEIEFAEGNEADEEKAVTRPNKEDMQEKEESTAAASENISPTEVSQDPDTAFRSTSTSATQQQEAMNAANVFDALTASLRELREEQDAGVLRANNPAGPIPGDGRTPNPVPQPASQQPIQPPRGPLLLQQNAQKDWDHTATQMVNFLLTGTAIGIMALLWQKLIV